MSNVIGNWAISRKYQKTDRVFLIGKPTDFFVGSGVIRFLSSLNWFTYAFYLWGPYNVPIKACFAKQYYSTTGTNSVFLSRLVQQKSNFCQKILKLEIFCLKRNTNQSLSVEPLREALPTVIDFVCHEALLWYYVLRWVVHIWRLAKDSFRNWFHIFCMSILSSTVSTYELLCAKSNLCRD